MWDIADDHIVVSSYSLRISVISLCIESRCRFPFPTHSHRLPNLLNQLIVVLTELTSVQNGGRSRKRGANRRINSRQKITVGPFTGKKDGGYLSLVSYSVVALIMNCFRARKERRNDYADLLLFECTYYMRVLY